jgi:Fic family protein
MQKEHIKPTKLNQLQDLLRALYIIYPKTCTINTFEMNLPQKYQPVLEEYHKLLTHFITLIHMTYRIKKNNKYITEKEDVIMSLQMLEIVSFKAIRNKEEKAAEYYILLKEVLKNDKIFTSVILQKLLNQPKTTVFNKIQILTENGYIEKIGGHKNKGYIYKLK